MALSATRAQSAQSQDHPIRKIRVVVDGILPTLNVDGGAHTSAISLDHDREVANGSDDARDEDLAEA